MWKKKQKQKKNQRPSVSIAELCFPWSLGGWRQDQQFFSLLTGWLHLPQSGRTQLASDVFPLQINASNGAHVGCGLKAVVSLTILCHLWTQLFVLWVSLDVICKNPWVQLYILFLSVYPNRNILDNLKVHTHVKYEKMIGHWTANAICWDHLIAQIYSILLRFLFELLWIVWSGC